MHTILHIINLRHRQIRCSSRSSNPNHNLTDSQQRDELGKLHVRLQDSRWNEEAKGLCSGDLTTRVHAVDCEDTGRWNTDDILPGCRDAAEVKGAEVERLEWGGWRDDVVHRVAAEEADVVLKGAWSC